MTSKRDLVRLAEIMREVRSSSTPLPESTLRLLDEAMGIHHRLEVQEAEYRAKAAMLMHDVQLATPPARPILMRRLTLNDYQAANLYAAIQAAGYSSRGFRSPLWSLNTGDWLGEIGNMLSDMHGQIPFRHKPNVEPEDMAQRAKDFQ